LTPVPDLPPPGWYADPEQPETDRYWDGQAWTDRRAPLAEQGEAAPGWALWVGYLGAFLLPLIGFIVGIYLLVRRAIGHGVAMIAISILIGVGGYLLTVDEDDDGPRQRSEVSERVDRKVERAREKVRRALQGLPPQEREAVRGAGGD
jgi:Protein of unknown function (DUF2510)